MSLKNNIGKFRPTQYGYGRTRIDWKALREQEVVPFGFYIRWQAITEVDTKDGRTAVIYEGEAELDITGLNDERISEIERITDLKRDKPTAVSFFSVGTMFLNQMKAEYQNPDEKTADNEDAFRWNEGSVWEDNCIGTISHVRYNGKIKSEKTGRMFHQIWVTYVPEDVQEELPA